jgi:hypothetical protein
VFGPSELLSLALLNCPWWYAYIKFAKLRMKTTRKIIKEKMEAEGRITAIFF